jgi:hypothetical protein
MSYQGAGWALLLHMRHQRHAKADVHGTRLITAALVLVVGAVSLTAVAPLVERSPTVRSTPARQDEHAPPELPRKHGERLVRPDAVAPRSSVPDAVRVRDVDVTPPRLRLPGRIGLIAHDPSGVIVRYASSAIDRRDGRVAARCVPASGSRFHPGITAVRCSAADRAGNVARGGFAVVIRTMPGSTPPLLLCFPDEPCDGTLEYAAWRIDEGLPAGLQRL